MWKHRHATTAPAAVILIRLLVGAVFLSEGMQKFLFPEQLGAGRGSDDMDQSRAGASDVLPAGTWMAGAPSLAR